MGGVNQRATQKAWMVTALALLAALVFYAFQPTLDNQLLRTWDTDEYVLFNEHIREISLESLQWMLTAFHASNWHPLTWLSHAIDYSLFGLDPVGHHFVSVVFHALNTALVFVLALQVFGRVAVPARPTDRDTSPLWQFLAAFATAALFGVHPQHVESVAWVAERKDVLCLFFCLLTAISYVRYSSPATNSRPAWYAAAIVFFALALLSKPMAVTLPVVLFLMDIYPLGRIKRSTPATGPGSVMGLLLEKLPFFALAIASALVTLLAQHLGGSVASLEGRGLDERVINAFGSTLFYLSKLLIPTGLSPFYAYDPASGGAVSPQQLIFIVAFVVITGLTILAWRRGRVFWLICWLVYLVTLSPVIGIIQVGNQAAADRYAYLPTLPFYFLAGAWLGQRLAGFRPASARFVGAASLLLAALVILSFQTRKQSDVWQNDVSLWGHAVRVDPLNAYARFRLGDAFMEYGRPGPAVEAYRSALALEPEHLWYGINLPQALLELQRYEEALGQVDTLLENDVTGGARLDLLLLRKAEALVGLERYEEARKTIRAALDVNPANHRAKSLLETLGGQSAPSLNDEPGNSQVEPN